MEQPCVNCHNSHPESPKTDWKVGDVRGIHEVSISQPIRGNSDRRFAIGIGDPFLRIIVTSDRSAALLFCQHGELCHRRIGITVAPANSIDNELITVTMSNADP